QPAAANAGSFLRRQWQSEQDGGDAVRAPQYADVPAQAHRGAHGRIAGRPGDALRCAAGAEDVSRGRAQLDQIKGEGSASGFEAASAMPATVSIALSESRPATARMSPKTARQRA